MTADTQRFISTQTQLSIQLVIGRVLECYSCTKKLEYLLIIAKISSLLRTERKSTVVITPWNAVSFTRKETFNMVCVTLEYNDWSLATNNDYDSLKLYMIC